jgi:hypothetical protein
MDAVEREMAIDELHVVRIAGEDLRQVGRRPPAERALEVGKLHDEHPRVGTAARRRSLSPVDHGPRRRRPRERDRDPTPVTEPGHKRVPSRFDPPGLQVTPHLLPDSGLVSRQLRSVLIIERVDLCLGDPADLGQHFGVHQLIHRDTVAGGLSPQERLDDQLVELLALQLVDLLVDLGERKRQGLLDGLLGDGLPIHVSEHGVLAGGTRRVRAHEEGEQDRRSNTRQDDQQATSHRQ